MKVADAVNRKKLRDAAYRARHADKIKEAARKFREINRREINETRRRKRLENLELSRQKRREYASRQNRKEWDTSYRLRHPDRVKASREKHKKAHPTAANDAIRKWRQENPEIARQRNLAYIRKNRVAHNARGRAWAVANPDKARSKVRRYQARKAKAMPKWLTKQQIREIDDMYAEAVRMEKDTSLPYHVDHIIPLQGKTVCGLHVPWNLQVIPARVNQEKGARIVS